MADRPFFRKSTSELEELFNAHKNVEIKANVKILKSIQAELKHRKRPGAKKLLARVEELFSPPPEPPVHPKPDPVHPIDPQGPIKVEPQPAASRKTGCLGLILLFGFIFSLAYMCKENIKDKYKEYKIAGSVAPGVSHSNITPLTQTSYSPYSYNDHVYVRGYTTKSGKYVSGHYRSRRNHNKHDNWSTKGNINPYTGKKGKKNP